MEDDTEADDFGGAGEIGDEHRVMNDIAIGAECWAILTRPIGKGDKGRREIEGVARVVVVDAHVDGAFRLFRVRIVRGDAVAGHEHRAFGAEVSRIWARRDSFTAAAP